ncbi:hypothetical protein L596_004489 [Steinernema carpocapsae]|uniref:Uncharacterized protein n=1 Tax=Steinernema carpocapsae TaxID=34508 RepID=A0A4U8UVX9_STECR|nr:hypothetical protein L596_004489 [Steinernema carpocapsae]
MGRSRLGADSYRSVRNVLAAKRRRGEMSGGEMSGGEMSGGETAAKCPAPKCPVPLLSEKIAKIWLTERAKWCELFDTACLRLTDRVGCFLGRGRTDLENSGSLRLIPDSWECVKVTLFDPAFGLYGPKEALETRRKKALKENVELRAEVDRLKGRVNDMMSLVDALKHALKHQKMRIRQTVDDLRTVIHTAQICRAQNARKIL